MKNTNELLFMQTTGKTLKLFNSFLNSNKPNYKAIIRKEIPKNVGISSLLRQMKYDVGILLKNYNILKENKKVIDDTQPIYLSMLSQDPGIMQSYYYTSQFISFPLTDDPRIITKRSLSDMLSNWIAYHRARIGLIESPFDIINRKEYFQPFKGRTVSVMEAESIIGSMLKTLIDDNDIVETSKAKELDSIDLISKLSSSGTAKHRTAAGLKDELVVTVVNYIQRRKIKKALEAREAAKKLDLKTKEDAIKAMNDLKEQLHNVQQAISITTGDISQLKNIETDLISRMKSLGQ